MFSDYQDILTIPGIPESEDEKYQLKSAPIGRFIIFERQKLSVVIDFREIEVISFI